ncbi:helix-turn-helix domain-containing protein [Spirillospora sp. NBC_01491]|uniref:helix-turn-helix domain-containing protein n=1 Tax=Spirillospora sp. NBC_01491 TaxID=2976007 RepID=UPI002E300939|nr:helix-turn-helix domain-containing protein [Spirillospora sp. NBC_01491]
MSKRISPPDDEDRPFVSQWNTLVRILLVESSVKHIARAAMDYANYHDGASCHPSNERLARETGYNERTVRDAWAVMRGLGMAQRVAFGVPHKGIADEYELMIPPGWKELPILGPRGRKFTCLYCAKLFNPQGNSSVNSGKDDKPGSDSIRFDVRKLCFCPTPRKTKGRDAPDCFVEWERQCLINEQTSWFKLGSDVWKCFRKARSDDW